MACHKARHFCGYQHIYASYQQYLHCKTVPPYIKYNHIKQDTDFFKSFQVSKKRIKNASDIQDSSVKEFQT